jgi:hypothetical protein
MTPDVEGKQKDDAADDFRIWRGPGAADSAGTAGLLAHLTTSIAVLPLAPRSTREGGADVFGELYALPGGSSLV